MISLCPSSAFNTAQELGEAWIEDIVSSRIVGCWKQLEQNWMRSNGVCLTSIRDLCIPRNSQDAFAISLVRIHGHHDYNWSCHHGSLDDLPCSTSAQHHSSPLHHACVLLFYDHDIMILMILMTHTFSYLSLTLSGLHPDPHSFNYSSISHLCSHLTQPVSGFRLPPNQNSGCPDDQPNIRAPGDDNQTTEMCWNISKN